MLKKFGAILAVFMILTISLADVFAGTTEDYINSLQSTASGSTYESYAKDNAADKSAAAAESTAASESAIAAQKKDFGETLEKVLKKGSAINNGQFIMTITSPEKDKDSTYKKSYVLSGNSAYNDVMIRIQKFNEETKEYEPMYNTDGESSWGIGDFQLFSKEIILTRGFNKIRIVSYRTSEDEVAKMEENIQMNSFTIELLSESIAKKVVRTVTDVSIEIKKSVSGLFKN